jgi:hypothetical protein
MYCYITMPRAVAAPPITTIPPTEAPWRGMHMEPSHLFEPSPVPLQLGVCSAEKELLHIMEGGVMK